MENVGNILPLVTKVNNIIIKCNPDYIARGGGGGKGSIWDWSFNNVGAVAKPIDSDKPIKFLAGRISKFGIYGSNREDFINIGDSSNLYINPGPGKDNLNIESTSPDKNSENIVINLIDEEEDTLLLSQSGKSSFKNLAVIMDSNDKISLKLKNYKTLPKSMTLIVPKDYNIETSRDTTKDSCIIDFYLVKNKGAQLNLLPLAGIIEKTNPEISDFHFEITILHRVSLDQ